MQSLGCLALPLQILERRLGVACGAIESFGQGPPLLGHLADAVGADGGVGDAEELQAAGEGVAEGVVGLVDPLQRVEVLGVDVDVDVTRDDVEAHG
ncbi:hypothetical protein [Streptomyces sp. Je 1-369]|uniref:hypothetical protein n=1 Tax=Streptomyces sp. Je 1-369 TaxID=2966192 RepID=UPI002286B367|nr:hypothetical protein [Streptomyces sp. Je 1-369]WAL99570.1 hypothetical protein NOO62_36930 [Streptomyces sp. Je 1-369]